MDEHGGEQTYFSINISCMGIAIACVQISQRFIYGLNMGAAQFPPSFPRRVVGASVRMCPGASSSLSRTNRGELGISEIHDHPQGARLWREASWSAGMGGWVRSGAILPLSFLSHVNNLSISYFSKWNHYSRLEERCHSAVINSSI